MRLRVASRERPSLATRAVPIGIAAVFVLSLLMVAPNPAYAAAFHGYAVAKETTGDGYTGVSDVRIDRAVSGQASDGCLGHFAGTPVYQTEWVIFTDLPQAWMELGTGHQCADTLRCWYWGYGEDGSWFPLGTYGNITNGLSHTFKISRAFDGVRNRFYFQVDGSTKGNVSGSDTGSRVEAGLESYSGSATVPGHAYSSLKYQKNGGSFSSWAGRDSNSVTSGMCGHWASDTSWYAGEGFASC